jgi:TPR repeat protein
MINLAHFYEWRGTNGDERCFDLAEEWGLAATKAGSAVGAHWLGCFYVRRKRYEDARRAFMIGEERDYAPSMIRLADYYIKGIGVDRDYSRVQDLLRTASRSGNLWAKRALARTYMNIGPGALTRVRGIFLCCLYDVHFYFLKKISPRSVRLKR